ncbi:hypothetical protein NPIL_412281 [Nephila pilipes]|uniref:Uncharacterized protein n=1 Tax=Nephila pilipes TaxID=299642 RepID=A0A8X6N6B1_NEPPI|nr:hypothetical protein NPIL_412281 [Nephila pilipes]
MRSGPGCPLLEFHDAAALAHRPDSLGREFDRMIHSEGEIDGQPRAALSYRSNLPSFQDPDFTYGLWIKYLI